MRIKVNPTRMELLRLRRRVSLAKRGHKLLKDKLDGLMQQFLSTKKKYLTLHADLENKLVAIFNKAIFATALSQPGEVFTSLPTTRIKASIRNMMGVKLPSYALNIDGEALYSNLKTTVEYKEAAQGFSTLLPDLVAFAALHQSLRQLAVQVRETRRRVNALEYVVIPELERGARSIGMKLSERERSTRVVLLKIAKGGN
ncbi:MAG: V-type ATP synthase subunit D [Candidatus Margulisbacteria bacterium]|nr:V-type ATP synthase subunit D [Candidatus Margulisiibacteriota bacterium]MBU1616214.1 V-type ATP synthase subunit D [Candidatus Margulisiibacteriota bacterium]MBU1867314.1 V-type ATP synthase subunit D [Candidatus Margulisiibacteriota bacterium]